MLSTTVAHCLAVWNIHTNALEQKDKDFFDAHVAQAMQESEDTLLATQTLVNKRLQQEGYTPEEAIAIAQRLLNKHVEALSEPLLRPLTATHSTS